jgi:hypothetical protein
MADESIRKEEDDEYSRFVSHYLRSIVLHRALPPRVYHYTTGAGLIGIIQSGSLWATQIACLNDTKELVHAVDELKDAIAKHRAVGVSVDAEFILQKMLGLLDKPDPEVSGAFVASFSEVDDDLSQWRAYGDGEGGYAIEFDTQALVNATAQYGSYFVPVYYTDQQKHTLFDDSIRWSETYFVQGLTTVPARDRELWGMLFAQRWLQHLSFLAPLIKHPKFAGEHERRIIHQLKPDDFSKLGFMQKQSLMSRYIPIRFAASDPDANGYTRLPITGIVIGPVRHREVSRISVGDLLVSKGYTVADVPVRISQVPYRSA